MMLTVTTMTWPQQAGTMQLVAALSPEAPGSPVVAALLMGAKYASKSVSQQWLNLCYWRWRRQGDAVLDGRHRCLRHGLQRRQGGRHHRRRRALRGRVRNWRRARPRPPRPMIRVTTIRCVSAAKHSLAETRRFVARLTCSPSRGRHVSARRLLSFETGHGLGCHELLHARTCRSAKSC